VTTPPPTANRPATTSARLTTVIGLLCISVLLWQVREFLLMVAVAMCGVAVLTIAVWLLREESPTPARRFAASLFAAPATLAFLGGIAGVIILLLGSIFPVQSNSGIPTATLIVVGNVGIVLGCVIAVLGLATTLRDILTPAPLARLTRSALICGTVPLVVGAALAATAVLLQSGSTAGGNPLLSEGLAALLSPDTIHLNLGSFLVTVTAATGAVWLLGVIVPYDDALADAGMSRRERARLRSVFTALSVVALLSAALFPAALYAEASAPPSDLRQMLGPGVFDLIQAVTTFALLRYLLITIAVVAIGATIATTVARVLYGQSATTVEWVIPSIAGTLVTVVAAIFAADVYEWVVDQTAARLPTAVATRFVDTTRSIRLSYGEAAAVVVAIGLLTIFAAGIAYGIRSSISLGYVSPSGGGYSLASSGLLLATIFAGALGSSVLLVFGGVLAAILVWDIGHNGVDLGRTIAPGTSRGVEIVHAGASLLVGLGAVALALGFHFLLDVSVDPSPERVLAVLLLTVGLASLVVAIRE